MSMNVPGTAPFRNNVSTVTIPATSDVMAHRFLKLDGTYAGPTDYCVGVSCNNQAAGEMVVVGCGGVDILEVGADIPEGTELIGADADGRAVPYASGQVRGYLYPGSYGNTGRWVSVILLQPQF